MITEVVVFKKLGFQILGCMDIGSMVKRVANHALTSLNFSSKEHVTSVSVPTAGTTHKRVMCIINTHMD